MCPPVLQQGHEQQTTITNDNLSLYLVCGLSRLKRPNKANWRWAEHEAHNSYLVVLSGRDSGKFRRISDSGPIFDPFFPIPIPIALPNGKIVPATARHVRAFLICLLITSRHKFVHVFPMLISGIPESEVEILIPAKGAVPAEFPTK